MRYRIFVLANMLLVFASLSCSSDPVSPEENIDISDYFPLKEDYSRKYIYGYSNVGNFSTGKSYHLIHGFCELKVQKIYKDRGQTAIQVISEFNIADNAITSWGYPEFYDTSSIKYNYSESFTYDILFQDNSFWYATSTPSFERLAMGTLNPLISRPQAQDNTVDLRLLHLVQSDALLLTDQSMELSGDTLSFSGLQISTLGGGQGLRVESNIKFIRGIGVYSIDFSLETGTEMTNHHLTAHLELVE